MFISCHALYVAIVENSPGNLSFRFFAGRLGIWLSDLRRSQGIWLSDLRCFLGNSIISFIFQNLPIKLFLARGGGRGSQKELQTCYVCREFQGAFKEILKCKRSFKVPLNSPPTNTKPAAMHEKIINDFSLISCHCLCRIANFLENWSWASRSHSQDLAR